MDRRAFLKASAILPAAASLPRLSFAQSAFDPRPTDKWRSFEVATRVEIVFPQGATRVWLPIPSVDSAYQKTIDNAWSGNAQTAKIVYDGKYGAGMLYAEWPTAEQNPVVELYSRVATRDHAVDFSARQGSAEKLAPEQRAFYTGSTEHMPTDGIVKKTAQDVTQGARTDYDKAKAIYEWIVENTYRDPKTRGCGVGDIKTMLETGNLGGKCADLNALYVGLARAALPGGGLRCRLRLGAGGPGRREKGRTRGEGAADDLERSVGAGGQAQIIRRVGDELARFQHCERFRAAQLEKRQAHFLHVSAGRNRRRSRRQPRSGQLQVHDDGEGTERLIPALGSKALGCAPRAFCFQGNTAIMRS